MPSIFPIHTHYVLKRATFHRLALTSARGEKKANSINVDSLHEIFNFTGLVIHERAPRNPYRLIHGNLLCDEVFGLLRRLAGAGVGLRDTGRDRQERVIASLAYGIQQVPDRERR